MPEGGAFARKSEAGAGRWYQLNRRQFRQETPCYPNNPATCTAA